MLTVISRKLTAFEGTGKLVPVPVPHEQRSHRIVALEKESALEIPALHSTKLTDGPGVYEISIYRSNEAGGTLVKLFAATCDAKDGALLCLDYNQASLLPGCQSAFAFVHRSHFYTL